MPRQPVGEAVAAIPPVPRAEPEKPAPASREQKAAKAPEAPRVEPPAGAAESKLAVRPRSSPWRSRLSFLRRRCRLPPPSAQAKAELAQAEAKKSQATADAKKPEKVAVREAVPESVAGPVAKEPALPKPVPATPKPVSKVEEAKAKAKAAAPAEKTSHAIDERIEKAIEKRAALVEPEKKNGAGRAASASDLDDKIAAAVRRRVREVGTAAVVGESTEQSGVGGAVGYGPGKGIGGIITDYDYVAYEPRSRRGSGTWVWAGAAASSSAVVE